MFYFSCRRYADSSGPIQFFTFICRQDVSDTVRFPPKNSYRYRSFVIYISLYLFMSYPVCPVCSSHPSTVPHFKALYSLNLGMLLGLHVSNETKSLVWTERGIQLFFSPFYVLLEIFFSDYSLEVNNPCGPCSQSRAVKYSEPPAPTLEIPATKASLNYVMSSTDITYIFPQTLRCE